MNILVNEIAYPANASKTAVIQSSAETPDANFDVKNSEDQVILSGNLKAFPSIAEWHTGKCWAADFSDITTPGRYQLSVSANGQTYTSSIKVDDGFSQLQLISAMTYWFKGQRATGEWAAADKNAPFAGPREGTWDVRGGWFDATGDVGVHTSHQSHTSYYNPQQLGFSVYAFYKSLELLQKKENGYVMLRRRMLDEATYGADSLMRRHVPGRAFIKSVERRNAFDLTSTTRKINYELHGSSDQFGDASTADKEDVTDLYYETSLRSGGGTCIAALAIAARHPYPGSEYSSNDYLSAAEQSLAYLQANNDQLLNDGKRNLVDDYCELLAVLELYKTTDSYSYLLRSRELVQAISARIEKFNGVNWLAVAPKMPFFHPSDEGLPLFTLAEYLQVEPNQADRHHTANLLKELFSTQFNLQLHSSDPFNYPLMLTKNLPSDMTTNVQYFFPHHTKAAPWWQGENARIASWAAAAADFIPSLSNDDLKIKLASLAQSQYDWIAGKNPFSVCMIEGFGEKHIQYHFGERDDFLNAPGGIVNGVTSGVKNESDIALIMNPSEGVDDNWRWAEQWIPHVSWMILTQSLLVSQSPEEHNHD
ncbi:glycoside hydrolase family 9 protein [Lacticaseibacillus hegangensis]|uniref:Glycoside hydrolase family 9 protein n=1 Tax=Lacticaseibacillus hegangensis TaxID=2486010 RepID=A0ABW4CXN9_9LACO|nr:glycoside hydrolase family 9 protein [Lacticaseibacillus hegangensis]